ncbi:MAG: T9SS type A sorting domain-containing protein, partial [Saprospiraceae bacterium]
SHLITFTATDDCLNHASNQATFTILGSSTNSVKEFADLSIRIFPNPVSNILNIVSDKAVNEPIHFFLFDAFGRPVLDSQFQSNAIQFPVNNYAAGIYFLRIETTHYTFSRKIIIK